MHKYRCCAIAIWSITASVHGSNFESHLKVMHYNVLASYLGSNYKQWFLYGKELKGCRDIDKRRQQARMVDERHLAGQRDGGRAFPAFGDWITRCARRAKKILTIDRNDDPCSAYANIFTDKELKHIIRYDEQYFPWDKRKFLILNRIVDESPDLLSLVELDDYRFFVKQLKPLGYNSRFFKRPKDRSLDGVGIFYLRDRFTLNDALEIQYSDGDRIGLLLHLVDKKKKGDLIYISTHLMKLPDDDEMERIREREVLELNEALSSFLAKNGLDPKKTPVIATGDFNAKRRGSAIRAMEKRGFKLAVDPALLADEAKLCTSKTVLRDEWIDYIWFLGPLVNIPLDLTRYGCERCDLLMPNETEGSDHLPVIAAFRTYADRFSLSEEIFEEGSPKNSDRRGYLGKSVPLAPVRRLMHQVEEKYGIDLKSRGEAHITIISPSEYAHIKNFLPADDINKIFMKRIASAKFTPLCIGRADKKIGEREMTTIFIVIDSPDLIRLRKDIFNTVKALGAHLAGDGNKFSPHITLGFTDRDLHADDGAVKDIGSCIAGIQIDP